MSRPRRCSGADGKPITARGWFDSESIALDGSFVYIGLERVNQVLRFDFSKGFTRARGEVVPMPPAVKQAAVQQGAGSAGVRAEGPAAGRHADRDVRTRPRCQRQSDRVSGRRPDARASSAFAAPTISISATRRCCRPATCWCWSGNSRWLAGVGIRIRRIPLHIAGAGRAWSTAPRSSRPIWATRSTTWKASTPIVTPEGDTVLTMVSDDNFSMIQRTLLLQFTLVE